MREAPLNYSRVQPTKILKLERIQSISLTIRLMPNNAVQMIGPPPAGMISLLQCAPPTLWALWLYAISRITASFFFSKVLLRPCLVLEKFCKIFQPVTSNL
jgi:hypothetical protein